MSERPNKRKVLIYAALTVITLAAFEGLRHNDFVCYDDPLYVSENAHVTEGLTFDSFVWAFKSWKDTANWHPVTWLSHMLDCELFGLNAHRHHLMNLLFHLSNTLLLFFIFERMTGAVWRSAFVAGVFGIHPVHVESVAWIAERKDVLSGLFWMLTIVAYLNYVSKGGRLRYLLMVLLFLSGLMAKSMLVTLPFVLLLLDYWPLNRLTIPDAGFKKRAAGLIYEKLPLFALTLIFCVIAFIAQRNAGAVVSIENSSIQLRAVNVLVSYISYMGKIFYPVDLAVLYPRRIDFSALEIAASFLVLAVISLSVIYFRRGYLEVGWLWYLGVLVPVIGLVQIGSHFIADRYLYLPLTGISIIAGWGFWELVRRKSYGRKLSGTLCAVIFVVLILLTRRQVGLWRDSRTLFHHTLAITKNNSVIHNNLGNILASQGKLDEAIDHLNQAVQLKPNNVDALYNLGRALYSQGKIDEAVRCFRRALQLKHDAEIYHSLGYALQVQGDFDQAVDNYRQAIRLKPDYADAYNSLGKVLYSQGKTDEAISCYTRALQINPDFAEAHHNFADLLMKIGRFDDALEQYLQASRLKPDWSSPLNGIARIYITHPDANKRDAGQAIVFAQRAAELTKYQDLAVLGTLASAYASAGQFEKAAKTAEKALELTAGKDEELSGQIRKQMESYRARLKIGDKK